MSFLKDTEEVKFFYNNVENLDLEYRKTTSRIKGLRAFNNWIKCLRVVEIGCGKGGDLHKWHKAPEKVSVYVGLDPTDVSIQQAQKRWEGYQKTLKYGDRVSRAEFYTQDCFGDLIMSIPIIKDVGFDVEGNGGGFDIVSMMFCMHYAFENETKVRKMLENVTGALKKRGKVIVLEIGAV